MNRQEYFDKTFDRAISDGLSPSSALKVSNELTKQYNPPITGKKSFAVQTPMGSGYSRDVLVGYPEDDLEAQHGGLSLDHSIWKKLPTKTEYEIDINHFTYDALNGVPNDLSPELQGFKGKLKDFYVADDGLRANLEFPDTDIGNKVKGMYDNGEFGISIEYKGYESGNVVKDWEMTGATLHKDPSYNKTKPKSL